MAKAAGTQGLATLKRAALDLHPSVRTASLAALGDRKDRSLVEFFKERFAADGSDAVRAEAVRSIGKAGDRSTLPFLEACAKVSSYRNMIAEAARQAMKAVAETTKRPDAGTAR